MSVQKDSNDYSSILKGAALFGGVQVFNILVNLVSGKLVAMLLGPEGMGIASLFTASKNTIQQFTGLGLNISSIQEISPAYERQDVDCIHLVVSILRRLLYSTALIGSIFSILFCRYLSELAFGNTDYKWHFALLSVAIFFTTLSNGELSILQGMRSIKKLAFASVVGSSTGLLVGVPMYYFLGYDGIVPAMIALSLATFAFYRYHTDRLVNLSGIVVQWRTMAPIAKKMIALGVILMVSSLLCTLVQYIVNTFINRTGSLEDVGLFQAANSITNQYVGLVFAAMGMDFYPRLSAVSSDNDKVRQLVNQQTEIVMLIVAPMAILLIGTAPILIRLLLTEKFLPLVPVIRWMGVGVVFKAVVFPMGYISFAKGDKKTFFWLEGIWGNLVMLCLNILFYYLWGIYGLGISFVAMYLLHLFVYVILTNHLYQFRFTSASLKLLVRNLLLMFAAFGCSFFPPRVWSYSIIAFLFALTSAFCIYDLNQRTEFWNKLRRKFFATECSERVK